MNKTVCVIFLICHYQLFILQPERKNAETASCGAAADIPFAFCCSIADMNHLHIVNSKTKPFLALPLTLQQPVSQIPVILAMRATLLYRYEYT